MGSTQNRERLVCFWLHDNVFLALHYARGAHEHDAYEKFLDLLEQRYAAYKDSLAS
jgi:hypothetical protein